MTCAIANSLTSRYNNPIIYQEALYVNPSPKRSEEDVWTCDGAEYVNGARGYAGYTAFRTAMRAVDPAIQVGAVGLPFANEYNNWGNEVITAAGATMDFYDIHQYAFFEPPASPAEALAQPHRVWHLIRTDLDAAFATHAAGWQIPIGVTEWNLFSVQEQDNGQLMTRAVNALFLADTIGQMIQQGIVLANQWDLTNGRAGNGTEYGLLHEDSGWYRSPQYYVFPLWSRFGGEMLPTTSTFDAVTQLSVYRGRVDETTVSLLAINKSRRRSRLRSTWTPPAVFSRSQVEQPTSYRQLH